MPQVMQRPISEMSFIQLFEFLQSGYERDIRTVEVYDAVNNTADVFDRFDDDQQYKLDMAWAAVLRARMAMAA
jgi:hypothetical protein